MLGSAPKDASQNDINVGNQNDLPTDTVSSISWIPSNNARLFATASWDSKVRIYDPQADNYSAKLVLKGGFEVDDPILSLDWCIDDTGKIFGGSINGTVKALDVQSGKSVNVGQHENSVKDVYWIPKANLALSLSFDKTMKFWDCRQQQPAAGVDLGAKVFCSDFLFPYIGIGLADERIMFLDLNNLQNLQGKPDSYESPLGKGSQVTALSFWTDLGGIGVGTHDGRINVSKFVQEKGSMKLHPQITFKAKKYPDNTPQSKQIVYPVHDVLFHSANKGFISTSGGDGSATYWDFVKKDRIIQYDYAGCPVTRAKFSPDGLMMAYALGYDWSLGIQGYMSCNTRVCVHVMKESDMVSK